MGGPPTLPRPHGQVARHDGPVRKERPPLKKKPRIQGAEIDRRAIGRFIDHLRDGRLPDQPDIELALELLGPYAQEPRKRGPKPLISRTLSDKKTQLHVAIVKHALALIAEGNSKTEAIAKSAEEFDVSDDQANDAFKHALQNVPFHPQGYSRKSMTLQGSIGLA
jgi:hypothetical protein